MACVRQCPGQVISATKTVKINVAGYDLEWAELNEHLQQGLCRRSSYQR